MVQSPIAVRTLAACQGEDIRSARCSGFFPLTPALSLGICLERGVDWSVAQIFNLLYCRIVFGRVLDHPNASASATGSQSATLRYSRVQLCATAAS